jgi:streptothricin acetyltransferase
MSFLYEIRALHAFTQAEIWPLLSGYETDEIYTVSKQETDQNTRIDIHLTRLEQPFRDDFYVDFTPEECQWHYRRISQGTCWGAYQGERLIGCAICELFPEDKVLKIFELHVLAEMRGLGVGRALMERVIALARDQHVPTMWLETQNTNVKAIRFYRRMGFSLESLDLSPAHYRDPRGNATGQVAFYMKRNLED